MKIGSISLHDDMIPMYRHNLICQQQRNRNMNNSIWKHFCLYIYALIFWDPREEKVFAIWRHWVTLQFIDVLLCIWWKGSQRLVNLKSAQNYIIDTSNSYVTMDTAIGTVCGHVGHVKVKRKQTVTTRHLFDYIKEIRFTVNSREILES